MKRVWTTALGLIAALTIYNGWVALPVANALSGEGNVTAIAYRRWLIHPNAIVFDVWSTGGGHASMADVDRNLFKAAEALRGRHYNYVVLAYRGRGHFLLDGDHFARIGQEWSYQNPIYLVRTLTEHVLNLDGTPAFGTWTGGWLGVMSHQLDDHNAMHERWWIRPALGLP